VVRILAANRTHRRGIAIVLFQLTIIASGNLSFLNWLTIVPALACFDDRFWAKILPRFLVERAGAAAASVRPSRPMLRTAWAVAAVVAVLSIQPVLNLFSRHQIMNTSFDPLELVNTYGAFGAVGKQRFNVIFEGTDAEDPDSAAAVWKPYPYNGLPVALDQRPPQIAPYQLRLDWQMWFAAMGSPNDYPWTLNLVWKLLHNDRNALSLFAGNPFPDKPPRYVRAVSYSYKFVPSSSGRWWDREQLGIWLPPLSADNAEFKTLLHEAGWVNDNAAPQNRAP
jgi:hypothetical protein